MLLESGGVGWTEGGGASSFGLGALGCSRLVGNLRGRGVLGRSEDLHNKAVQMEGYWVI